MTSSSPPLEAQRFGRSQTPESPRPVHLPEPQKIPVLMNQMDPVFNDTATYNIPNVQNFSPYSDTHSRTFADPSVEEHDAVQNFLRNAEAESSRTEEAAGTALTDAKSAQDSSDAKPIHYSSNIPSSAFSLSESNAQTNDPSPNATANAPAAPPTIKQTSSFSADPSISAINEPTRGQESDIDDQPKTTEPTSDVNMADQPLALSDGGVDYQSLLDTIAQSASTAPAAETIAAPTTAASVPSQDASSLPSVPGLPPKPPPQENPSEFSGYQNHDSVPRYQSFLGAEQPSTYQAHPKSDTIAASLPSAFRSTENGLSSSTAFSPSNIGPPSDNAFPKPIDAANTQIQNAPGVTSVAGERPWTPKTQSLYDQFLEDERRYVTEGIWDKFPMGSRLFVGNLPSEKVTKRDLFHIFHKHGRLAQISIKQAYGFVQFLEASSCYNALAAEQGVEIRGRKVHLEISKPQKNTRNQNAGNKTNARRRSRSPERGVSRSSMDRQFGKSQFSNQREEPMRRRDDYRPGRSPSPRSYRSRDDYRPGLQSPRGYPSDGRPRSPAYAAFPPTQQGYDDDAALPLPRRDPRSVPDVQVLVLDPALPQGFISWVEQGFQSKGLRCGTIRLSPRLPLQAVVKRQIIEGVQAVVKLTQSNQYHSKIPLQVFDRSAGASNVNFNEYADLDVSVAADIVIHARQKERGFVSQPPTPQFSPGGFNPQAGFGHSHMPPQQYPQVSQPQFPQRPPQPSTQYPYPQVPQQQQQQQYPGTNATPTTPNSNAPNLQQLLANLRQPQDSQQFQQAATAAQGGRPTDLGGLLSNIAARQQSQNQQYNQGSNQGQAQSPQGYGTGTQPNVQNIMDQLARYGR